MAFQRRSWKVQHLGWMGMAALIVAALAGVFSDGPLSAATATDSAGIVTVQYERFVRQNSPTRIRIRIDPKIAAAGTILRIGGAVAEEFTIEAVQPPPVVGSTAQGALLLRLAPTAPDVAGTLYLTLQADRSGRQRSEIGLAGRPPARLLQFVFP